MGAGDGDAAFQPHQLGQHLGAAHHRQPLRARGDKLRIVGLDGRGDDDDLGAGQILRRVADGDFMPLSRSRLTLALSVWSEPCTRIAEIGQHLGDAAHADAADADEMHRADVARQFHAVPRIVLPGYAAHCQSLTPMKDMDGRNKSGRDE